MRFLLPLLFVVAACAQNLPGIEDTISPAAQNDPFPQLQPIEPLLARAEAGSTVEAASEQLSARAANLRRKGRALRGRTIVDGQDRMRALRRN